MTKFKRTASSKNWILPDEPFPLYQMERRHLKWAQTPQKARHRIRLLFILTLAIIISAWILTIYYDPDARGDHIWLFYGIIGIGSLTILSGLQDFATMIVTFGSLRDEKVMQRWDLLVLASEKEKLVRSKHSYARLRIARMLTFNLAVRVGVLICMLLIIFFGSYFYDGIRSLDGLIWELQNNTIEFFLSSSGFALLGLFYLIEPIWRVKAFTSIGVALSGRINNIALLAPISFVVLVALWILQAIIIWMTTAFLAWSSWQLDRLYYDFTREWIPTWLGWLGFLTIPLIYLAIAFIFYWSLRKIAYGRIYRTIP